MADSEDEIYVSTDIEVDGPIPGPHSMLSLGSAALSADGTVLDTFSANLVTLQGATAHPTTSEWWADHPDAYAQTRLNLQEPRQAMEEYYAWVCGLGGSPVFVGYPAAFDFMFVYWYLMTFVGDSPFGHSALDVRSFAMAELRRSYTDTGMHSFPARWLTDSDHTHIAVEDALEQGAVFCKALQENRAKNDNR